MKRMTHAKLLHYVQFKYKAFPHNSSVYEGSDVEHPVRRDRVDYTFDEIKYALCLYRPSALI